MDMEYGSIEDCPCNHCDEMPDCEGRCAAFRRWESDKIDLEQD